MSLFVALAERDRETGLYVGVVPTMAGAHSQAASLPELRRNLAEVLSMLFEGQSQAVAANQIAIQLTPLP